VRSADPFKPLAAVVSSLSVRGVVMVVIPMDSTGRSFISKMREGMPEQLVDWSTGSRA
jgi:hypothetical protein